MAVAAESQITRPKLPAAAESDTPKRPRDQVSQNALLELPVPELVQTILNLRQEIDALRIRPLNAGEHSIIKDVSARDSTQLNQQRKALDDAHEQLAKIKEELKSEKARAKEAERSRNKMKKQLLLATKVEATFYDDGYFKEQIQQLRWEVYNWIKDRRWEVASLGRHRHVPKAYRFLRTTCPDYQDYVGSKGGMELLIQAHIWQYFGREVFISRCFWAETRARSHAEKDISNNPFSVLRAHLSMQPFEVTVWKITS
jgi:hypothetical protein